jgi:hypothetical protein
MTTTPPSGSTRQSARNRGLTWVSAITLGAGAASALGAAAIATTLPSLTAATSATAAVAGATSANTNYGSTLQASAAPSATNIPPVATTGAS